ncbi:unnamed protein product, partial [Ectocarpus sp. 8 AP-2014]
GHSKGVVCLSQISLRSGEITTGLVCGGDLLDEGYSERCVGSRAPPVFVSNQQTNARRYALRHSFMLTNHHSVGTAKIVLPHLRQRWNLRQRRSNAARCVHPQKKLLTAHTRVRDWFWFCARFRKKNRLAGRLANQFLRGARQLNKHRRHSIPFERKNWDDFKARE